MRGIIAGVALVAVLAITACSGDDAATTTASTAEGTATTEFTGDGAPPGESTAQPQTNGSCAPAVGQSLDQVEDLFGREPDYVDVKEGLATLYVWYFGTGALVSVSSFGDTVGDWTWTDDSGIYRFKEPVPTCPLPEPEDDHSRALP